MCKKNDTKIQVQCVGMSAVQVTGSMYLVTCPTGEQILLDCGLYQSANKYECYKVNSGKFDFKPSELTAVLISHTHGDHNLLAPKLYKDGATCKTYMSYESIDMVKPMALDSVKIMERDTMALNRRYKKSYEPIYNEDDVYNYLDNIYGVEYNDMIEITENVSVQFIPSGHIFGSCQIVLYIKKPSGNIVKIAYSGDLGNIIFEQPFVRDFEKVVKANMYIGECTYNDKNRSVKKEQRAKDIEMIKNIVEQTCIDNKGILLIPTFALQRMEVILHTLWSIYKDDKDFNIPIIVDSPLAVNLLDCFLLNLEGEDRELLEQILSWKNIKVIRTIEESQAWVLDTKPKIVCSSSGMLTQGRSIMYLKKILPRKNCCILTIGYCAEGTLAWTIKNRSDQKTITIDEKAYPNRCDIKSLRSFSSHMQYEELMNYYVNLANNGCNTIWLVHGDENKIKFKKELEERISKINKSTKVIATNFDTTTRL